MLARRERERERETLMRRVHSGMFWQHFAFASCHEHVQREREREKDPAVLGKASGFPGSRAISEMNVISHPPLRHLAYVTFSRTHSHKHSTGNSSNWTHSFLSTPFLRYNRQPPSHHFTPITHMARDPADVTDYFLGLPMFMKGRIFWSCKILDSEILVEIIFMRIFVCGCVCELDSKSKNRWKFKFDFWFRYQNHKNDKNLIIIVPGRQYS